MTTETRTQHTPEPWRIVHSTGGRAAVVGADETSIGEWPLGFGETALDIERQVACVNACAGINPEAVPELLAACRAVVNAWHADDRNFEHEIAHGTPTKLAACRAAIARATEGHADAR